MVYVLLSTFDALAVGWGVLLSSKRVILGVKSLSQPLY